MKRTLILSLAGVAGFVASCSFGPMWSTPEMPVPAEFRGVGVAGSTMADLPWQQVLKDDNLQKLLDDVFTSNRSLEAMMHNVNSAKRYITIARAPLFPSLGYLAQGSQGASSPSSVASADEHKIPGAAGLSASWELDLWGKTRKGVESAEAQALAAEESLNSMRISLMKQVANGYLCLIMLDEQLKIAHDAVASYRESLTLFENQLEGGVADRLQTASAQAALAAKVAGPVAAAGDAPAESAVHEHFEVHVFRSFLVHLADLVDGKFAGKHYALNTQFFRGEHVARGRNVGKSGKVQFTFKACLTGYINEADILNAEAVRLGIALETLDKAASGKDITSLDKRVEGHIDAPTILVGEIHHTGQLGGAEVFGSGTGGEVFQAKVRGIGPGGHACQKAGHVAGGSQKFRQGSACHGILSL